MVPFSITKSYAQWARSLMRSCIFVYTPLAPRCICIYNECLILRRGRAFIFYIYIYKSKTFQSFNFILFIYLYKNNAPTEGYGATCAGMVYQRSCCGLQEALFQNFLKKLFAALLFRKFRNQMV